MGFSRQQAEENPPPKSNPLGRAWRCRYKRVCKRPRKGSRGNQRPQAGFPSTAAATKGAAAESRLGGHAHAARHAQAEHAVDLLAGDDRIVRRLHDAGIVH